MLSRIFSLFLIAILVAGCATPVKREEITPVYTAKAPSHITIAVVDDRSYVLDGDKEPWFEGLIRSGFGIPYTFNRPKSPEGESFSDRLAKMLNDTFSDAGSEVSVVRLPPGSSDTKAIEAMRPSLTDAGLLVHIIDSKFDAGGFKFEYRYNFEVAVVDDTGEITARQVFQGSDANPPSDKHTVWDMHSVVYKEKFESFLADPTIRTALAQ